MNNEEREFVEKICKNVDSKLRSQVETVVQTVLVLQKKLDDNYEEYLDAPLSLNMTLGNGESTTRANPFVQEYRTLFKDYMNALVQLTKLIDDVSVEEEINTLSSIKEKIRLVK